MKFKLNTIENFKNRGITLSKEIFEFALKEFNKKVEKKTALGTIILNKDDLSKREMLTNFAKVTHMIEKIDFDTFECEIKFLDTPMLKMIETILQKIRTELNDEVFDLHVVGIGSTTNNFITNDYKIVGMDLIRKDL